MSKVNYRKSDIMEFLERQESLTLQAVRDEYSNMYNATLCKVIGDIPYLSDLLAVADEQADKLQGILDRIEDMALENFELRQCYNPFKMREKATNIDPKREIHHCLTDKNGVLGSIKEQGEQRKKAVEREYTKVKNQIKLMTKPIEMRKYLESLGFDMSFLDTCAVENVVIESAIAAIEKKNLFPYKELTVKE